MTVAHVGSKARRYGRALARVALEAGVEAQVGEEMRGLVDYFEQTPLMRLLLESRATTRERQEKLVAAIEKALPELSTITRNFLRLVVEARRFSLFAQAATAYEQELARHAGILDVEVVSAQALDEKQRQALQAALARTVATGKQLRLTERVDPSLLAGAVTRIGSVVFDGSLSTQLGQLRHQLISE